MLSMLNNYLSSFMKIRVHENFIAMRFKYKLLNCINYICVCANFISMELNVILMIDQFHIRSILHLLK
jgi:hypothetical protein